MIIITIRGDLMNISAIISEYNPFHKGHGFQLSQTRKITNCDGVLSIMSGNFVQRGEPAIIDKWIRTRMALENGVDLVLELPVIFSLSSAEFFANGAVTILHKIGVVDNLCFGSECGDIDMLKRISEVLYREPQEYKELLHSFLNRGVPYHSARSMAMVTFLEKSKYELNTVISSAMNSSNNILGIEYCKSLFKNNSTIKPVTIKREGGSYNSCDINDRFSSATAIRKIIKENTSCDNLKKEVPESSYKIIKELFENNYKFVFDENLFHLLKYKCLQTPEALAKIPDVREGLDNRIYEAFLNSKNFPELMEKIKTKRYTYTRIKRILCQFFVGFDKFDTSHFRNAASNYVRVLGFNSNGAEILREMKRKSKLDVLMKMPKNPDDMLALDLLSTHMYSLINPNIKPSSDYLNSPIRI